MKQLFLFLTLILILQNSVILSQSRKDLKNIPHDWTKYIAEDQSFEVYFPTTPQENPSSIEKVFEGKHVKFYHSTISEKESYALGYSNFASPVESNLQKEAIYEISAGYDAKLIKFYQQGFLGVEYLVDDSQNKITFTRRLIIAKQRLFQLSVSTPLYSNLSLKQKQVYRQKIDKFFESLVIKKIPPPKFTALPLLPVTLENQLSERKYSNKFLGFTLEIPLAFEVDHLHRTKIAPAEKKDFEKLSKPMQWLINNKVKLLSAIKKAGPGSPPRFFCFILRPDFNGTTLAEFIEEEKSLQLLGGINKLSLPVQPSKIGNLESLMFEVQSTESLKKERIFLLERKGLFLKISFEYDKKEDLADLESLLNSLKFLE